MQTCLVQAFERDWRMGREKNVELPRIGARFDWVARAHIQIRMHHTHHSLLWLADDGRGEYAETRYIRLSVIYTIAIVGIDARLGSATVSARLNQQRSRSNDFILCVHSSVCRWLVFYFSFFFFLHCSLLWLRNERDMLGEGIIVWWSTTTTTTRRWWWWCRHALQRALVICRRWVMEGWRWSEW